MAIAEFRDPRAGGGFVIVVHVRAFSDTEPGGYGTVVGTWSLEMAEVSRIAVAFEGATVGEGPVVIRAEEANARWPGNRGALDGEQLPVREEAFISPRAVHLLHVPARLRSPVRRPQPEGSACGNGRDRVVPARIPVPGEHLG